MADQGEPAPPPLFLDQTEARRAEEKNLRPPPLLSQGLDDHPLPPYLKDWIRHGLFFKKMYGNQFGEFVCEYWDT